MKIEQMQTKPHKIVNYFTKSCQSFVALFILGLQILDSLRPITGMFLEVVEITPEQAKIFNHLNMGQMLGQFGAQFAFYTIWINYLFIFTLLFSWLFNFKINRYWQTYLMTYLVIISCAFWFFIAPFWIWGSGPWNDFMTINQHFLILLVAIWWYIKTKDKYQLKNSTKTRYVLIIPFLYFSFIFMIYCLSQFQLVPYIFFYFQNIFWLNLPLELSIFLTFCLLVCLMFFHLAINYLWIKINNKLVSNHIKDKIQKNKLQN